MPDNQTQIKAEDLILEANASGWADVAKLYRRDSKGKIRFWRVEVFQGVSDADYGEYGYRAFSGLEGDGFTETGGAFVYTPEVNVGRSNHRNSKTQAVNEAVNAVNKRLRQGYTLSMPGSADAAKARPILKPMLLDKFSKRLPQVVAGLNSDVGEYLVTQPKLDGVRCIATADGLFSRQGTRITSCDHVWQALEPHLAENPDTVLDGELYVEGFDIGRISGAVARKAASPDSLELRYSMFDMPSAKGDFSARHEELTSLWADFFYDKHPLAVLEYAVIPHNDDDLMATARNLQSRYVAAGYEGAVIRVCHKDGLSAPAKYHYRMNHRSALTLKVTERESGEFKLLDILDGNGDWANIAKTAVVDLGLGQTCQVGIKGNQTQLTQMLKDKEMFIGRMATVEFFGYTVHGKLRQGVLVNPARWDYDPNADRVVDTGR